MATTTKNYKQTSHLPRVIYTEPAPLSGMNYTNTPLQPGYAKIVYNLVENPEGTGLRARPGAKKVEVYTGILPNLTLINKLKYNFTNKRYYVNTETSAEDVFIKDIVKNYNRYYIEYVVSEYGPIIHCIYKDREDSYIYSKTGLGVKEPYVLGAPLTRFSNYYGLQDFDPSMVVESSVCKLPVSNINNKLIYTKGFETNDVIVLCKRGHYCIESAWLSSNAVWFEAPYSNYTIPKLNINTEDTDYVIPSTNTDSKAFKNKSLPFYQQTSKRYSEENDLIEIIYSKVAFPYYYPRFYDYKVQPIALQESTGLIIPEILQEFYDIEPLRNSSDETSTPFGFFKNGKRYITYIPDRITKHRAYFEKNNDIPITLFKLPSNKVNDFRTSGISLINQRPIYTIYINNIKLQRSVNENGIYSQTLDKCSYHISTSLNYTINMSTSLTGNSIIIPEGYYDILNNSIYKDLPLGAFLQISESSSYNLSETEEGYYTAIPTIDINNSGLTYDMLYYNEKSPYNSNPHYESFSKDELILFPAGIYLNKIYIDIIDYINHCKSLLKDGINTNNSIREISCPNIQIKFYFDNYSDAPQEIKPKIPTVKEALTYGYNMLLANPYSFKGVKNNSLNNYIQFGGLLAYDQNDNIVLNPVSNVPYKFKVISDTSSSTVPACMLIDYKTVAQDVWTKISTDFETPDELLKLSDFSGQNDKEISFTWTPNVTNAIIRIRFYAKTENRLYQDTFASEDKLKEFLAQTTTNTFNGIIFEVTSRSVPIYYQATYNEESKYTIAITYYPEAESKTEDDLFAKGYRNILTNAITMSFERNYESNVNVKNYDFSTAQGMTYWYNRLVVWGVDSGANILFFSDINDPSYFPYPNNISVFDEPVIKAVPFQDNLLVFTTTKIWKITLSEDGMSWYEECIQKNLRVTEQEAHLIMPLTNMVFFKSGLYYYLLTPSSKGTGELVIASISKPITDILQSPISFFLELETQVYGNKHDNIYLRETNVYLDASEIHVVYSYFSSLFNDKNVAEATTNTVYAEALRNYVLSYNMNTRKWRVWSFDSDTVPKVLYRDSVNNAVWYVLSSRFSDEKYEDLLNSDSLNFYNRIYTFQFLLYDVYDAEYNKQNIDYGIPGSHIYYQYLDTGNRDIRKEYYKKFREYQVHFNNRSNENLKFYIEFSLDDNPVIPLYSGSVEPDADLGYAYNLNQEAETTIYGTVTTLREGLVYTVDKTMWNLFHLMKCKAPITSKGYYPALHILSKNTYSYDMLDITWVYRLKNAR